MASTQHPRAVIGVIATAGALAVLLAPGCARPSSSIEVRTVDTSRVVSATGLDLERRASVAERFGLSAAVSMPSKSPRPQGSSAAAPAPVADSAAESPFAWTTPAGWTEIAPTALRSANFRPAGDARAECYATLLAGDAGGLAANVQRWQAQLGLSPFGVDALARLEKRPFLGREATFVDLEGTWSGMTGAEARPGWRLFGLLLVEPTGSVFLKMTGPADVLARELVAFHELAASFRARGAPPAAAREPFVSPNSAAGFTFTTPAGWSRAPDRPARAFSLYAGQGDDVSCYVTALPGDAGGVLANVNRWRGQLGLAGLAENDVARLPRIEFLGGTGALVECDGADASLLATLGATPTRSIFVKMTGPRARIEAERTAFLAFCASLREAN